MTDIDPAMLEKFQKFQAMLADSPEIVEALNSPEILAMAALAAKKNQAGPSATPAPVPVPKADDAAPAEPSYPMVGHGVSDDVSVFSEMTTPTVMTRQTVEEEEYYPEIDDSGVSSSGLGGAPRRIGMKIGVAADANGVLPPPPPKPKNRVRNPLVAARSRGLARPAKQMSKISEHTTNTNEGSVSSESTEPELRLKRPSLVAKKSNWRPRTASSSVLARSSSQDKHPFGGSVSPTRRTNTSGSNGRGVGRNRSMPTNMKRPEAKKPGSSSLHTPIKTGSSSHHSLKTGSSSSHHSRKGGSDEGSQASFEDDAESSISHDAVDRAVSAALKPKSASKVTQPPPRTSENRGRSHGGAARQSRGRSVPRTRLKSSNSAGARTPATNSSSKIDRIKARGRSVSQSRRQSESRARQRSESRNRQRSESRSRQRSASRTRQRSESRGRKPSKTASTTPSTVEKEPVAILVWDDEKEEDNDSKDSNRGESAEPVLATDNNPTEDSSESHSRRSSVKIPAVFLKSSSSATSSYNSSRFGKGTNGSIKSSASLFSPKSKKANATVETTEPIVISDDETGSPTPSSNSRDHSPSPSPKPSSSRSNSEEQKKTNTTSTDDDEEEDYVPRKIRKPAKQAKPVATSTAEKISNGDKAAVPNLDHLKACLTPVGDAFSRQADTSRPDDCLMGDGTFAATRKKKEKKRFGGTGIDRSDDWLGGSGKTAKRTWKVKGT